MPTGKGGVCASAARTSAAPRGCRSGRAEIGSTQRTREDAWHGRGGPASAYGRRRRSASGCSGYPRRSWSSCPWPSPLAPRASSTGRTSTRARSAAPTSTGPESIGASSTRPAARSASRSTPATSTGPISAQSAAPTSTGAGSIGASSRSRAARSASRSTPATSTGRTSPPPGRSAAPTSTGPASIRASSPSRTAASGVAVDAGHVYWTDAYSFPPGTIGRANLDGTGVDQSFISGAQGPFGVAVDAGHVYWANGNFPGSIGRANLDGTGVDQSFISGGVLSVRRCGRRRSPLLGERLEHDRPRQPRRQRRRSELHQRGQLPPRHRGGRPLLPRDDDHLRSAGTHQ